MVLARNTGLAPWEFPVMGKPLQLTRKGGGARQWMKHCGLGRLQPCSVSLSLLSESGVLRS